jgi:hypothetical protein
MTSARISQADPEQTIHDAPGPTWCGPAMNARRFPPPWTVEELEACFVVGDHDRQQLAYVYFEDKPGRRSAPTARRSAADRGEHRKAAGVVAPVPMSAFGGKADIARICFDVCF